MIFETSGMISSPIWVFRVFRHLYPWEMHAPGKSYSFDKHPQRDMNNSWLSKTRYMWEYLCICVYVNKREIERWGGRKGIYFSSNWSKVFLTTQHHSTSSLASGYQSFEKTSKKKHLNFRFVCSGYKRKKQQTNK